jgi:hypothetical protein
MADQEEVRLAERIEAEAWADLYAAAPPGFTARAGLRCEPRAGATCLLAPGIPMALFNRALAIGMGAPATEGDLDEVMELYRAAGARSFWIHAGPASRPAALTAWLEARGMAPGEPASWAKVLRDAGPVAEVATRLRVEPVARGRAGELAQVLATAHGMPSPFAAWFAALVGRAGWHAYGVLDGDRIVGGGMAFVAGQRAWLGVGGTLPSHRGRGGQGAVMARRIRDAIAMGCTAIGTETGDTPANPSLHNMLRAGFRRVCSRVNFSPAA